MSAKVKAAHRLASVATLYRAFGNHLLPPDVWDAVKNDLAIDLAEGRTVMIRTYRCKRCGDIERFEVLAGKVP